MIGASLVGAVASHIPNLHCVMLDGGLCLGLTSRGFLCISTRTENTKESIDGIEDVLLKNNDTLPLVLHVSGPNLHQREDLLIVANDVAAVLRHSTGSIDSCVGQARTDRPRKDGTQHEHVVVVDVDVEECWVFQNGNVPMSVMIFLSDVRQRSVVWLASCLELERTLDGRVETVDVDGTTQRELVLFGSRREEGSDKLDDDVYK